MVAPSHTSTSFTTMTRDGASLSGHRRGDGPPMLLISGLGGTAAFWEPSVAGLPGYHCITLDQRGIGKSTRGTAAVSISQLARDILDVLDTLGLESAALAGHSTGGCIAMECALLAPSRVNSLVLSGTWAGPNEYMTRLFDARLRLLEADPALYQNLNPYLSFPIEYLLARPEVMPAYRPDPWYAQKVAIVRERIHALLQFDRRGAISKLDMPCLVLGAKDDLVVPNILQQEIADLIPSAQRHFFDGGGHFYPLSRTSAFVEQITDWRQGLQ